MKLIRKKELSFVDGYLVTTDDELVTLGGLAAEMNEIIEIQDLVEFLKNHRRDINDASTDPVVYHPEKVDTVRPLTLGKVAATPLADSLKADAEALANEWLDVQVYKDVDAHLARYHSMAKWFSTPYVIAIPSDMPPVKFVTNPISMTEDEVVGIIEEYHDPELVRLRNKIQFDFS